MSIDSIKDSSSLEGLEIMKTGNSTFPRVTFSNPGAGNFGFGLASTSVAHGLGYTPTVMAFVQVSDTGITYPLPCNLQLAVTTSTMYDIAYACTVDTQFAYFFIYIVCYGNSFSFNANTFQYYLLRNKAKRLI